MVPVCRPSMPLSTGPTLFLAPSPTEWQGRHFLKEFSPAARSCADADNADAASMNAPSAILVIVAPVVYSNAVEAPAAISNGRPPWPCQRSYPALLACPAGAFAGTAVISRGAPISLMFGDIIRTGRGAGK